MLKPFLGRQGFRREGMENNAYSRTIKSRGSGFPLQGHEGSEESSLMGQPKSWMGGLGETVGLKSKGMNGRFF